MHTVTVNSWEDRCEPWTCELQGEEESKLRAQLSGLGQELSSEKSRATELQKALEQSQGSLTKLQSDFYGKESEVSALRQDMKVMCVAVGYDDMYLLVIEECVLFILLFLQSIIGLSFLKKDLFL